MDQERRSFLLGLGSTAIALPLSPLAAADGAASLPKLGPEEAPARALDYIPNSRFAEKTCIGCQFYTDASTDCGPCILFPGYSVSGDGYCASWFARIG